LQAINDRPKLRWHELIIGALQVLLNASCHLGGTVSFKIVHAVSSGHRTGNPS
jgi:hypothetical protein